MAEIWTVCNFLEAFAPSALAEDWDNVGLLVGDREAPARKIMTCLTVTPASADEAIEQSADLIVSHHPLPFRPLKRLTTDTAPGRLLLRLIRAGIAIYSPHTAFDSARNGINQWLAGRLGLAKIAPLIPAELGEELGTGRYGCLEAALSREALADRLKEALDLNRIQLAGGSEQQITKVAVACGAAGELLGAARSAGCGALVLGETNFHTCLEAEANGMTLLLTGHYASERFAIEILADLLGAEFRDAYVWASRREEDPLTWY